MIKKAACIALCSVLTVGTIAANAKTMQFTMNENKVDILDSTIENVDIDSAPYLLNDRTMVPIRVISEKFGATVNWDEATQTATIVKDTKTVKLTLNSNTAYVNDTAVTLDAAPEQTNDRTMVPLRFVSEALGFNVKYIELTDQVLISDEKTLFTINGEDIMPCEFEAIYSIYKLQYGVDYSHENISTMYSDFKTAYEMAAKNSAYVINDDEKQGIKDDIPNYTAACKDSVLGAAMANVLNKYSCANNYQQQTFEEFKNQVTDEEAEKAYTDNFICAKHILVRNTNEKAEEIVKEIQTKLKKKTDFDELIKEYGEDPGMQSQPDGYVFTTGKMIKEFEDAAFALKENEVSDVVETSLGYHIIKRLPLPEITDDAKNIAKYIVADTKMNDFNNAFVANSDVADNYTAEQLLEMYK